MATKTAGAWSVTTFPGGINANLDGILSLLASGGSNADSAKVVQGTDQNNAAICAVFMKS
jgi:hypothetical protein